VTGLGNVLSKVKANITDIPYAWRGIGS